MTDAFPDPTEPAPTDLLDFPPLPQQSGGPGPGGPGGPDTPQDPDAGRIRVVPDSEATARLRIMLPTQPPTPSTALRPQATWEDTHAEQDSQIEAFARVAASPASPSTLPSQLAAMTTATMVIPLPPSVRPGSGLLTRTLPPDQAAQANAARIGDAFRDTIEEIFGVDLDTVDPAEIGLAPLEDRSAAAPGAAAAAFGAEEPGYAARYAADEPGADAAYPAESGSGYRAEQLAEQAFAPTLFPRPVPAEVFGGAYGVPTQAPFGGVPEQADPFGQNQRGAADPHRHALALRYLGGIFHDSSGESSYLDPEEIDQGWIPSAFGAVPPDAPTEQIARVPALDPPHGGPAGVFTPARTSAAPTRTPAAPTRTPAAPTRTPAAPAAAPIPRASAVDETAVLPAQSPVEPAHGRSGSRRPRHVPDEQAEQRTARRHGAAAADKQPAEKGREPAESGKRGRTLTILGLCVAALALLYGIALLVAGGVLGGKVPAGMSVDGVAIGGMSSAAARDTLQAQLGPLSEKPVQLQVGQSPASIDPAKAGLTLDVVGTVAAAESARTNPFTVIPALFGVGHQVTPVVAVDRSELTNALDAVASAYDTQLVEGRITFANGQPVVTAPREGRGFDVAAAVNAVGSGYLQVTPIILPVNALTPLATPEALQNALEQLARPAVSGPITIDTGGVTTVLTPDQIGAALSIGPNQSGAMVPTVNGAMLRTDLNPAALAGEQPGVDAAFTVVDGKPNLVPEKDGAGYSAPALARAVAGVLAQTTAAGRTVTVPRGPLPPAFTTADAQALDVQAVLGQAKLVVPVAPDRAADLAHAVALANGSVVQPNAAWSFDKTVGAPIVGNGYTEPAGSAQNGVDVSGADDLLATAVFDAAFRSGMGDTVHHPNSVYFSRYPVGLDAAVVWPGTDLQWSNSSGHPVYLHVAYVSDSLEVDLLGQPAYDQVDVSVSNRQGVVAPTGAAHYGCPAESASDGFQVNVTRVLTRAGAQVGTEQFHVTYEPYAGSTCAAGATQSPSSGAGATGRPSSGSGSSSTPTGGSTGGTGGSSPPPTSPSQPNPPPTSSGGALGGLLH